MHQVNLGLWVHLLNAIFFDLQAFLASVKRTSGSSYYGKEGQATVWNRYVYTYLYCCVFLHSNFGLIM